MFLPGFTHANRPWLAATLTGLLFAGVVHGESPKPDQVTQVSVINALMLGQYTGTVPIEEVLEFGNFGLGTVDHLDGELIILDGVAWQAKSDGTVHRCGSEMTTPFAVITPFEAESTFEVPPVASLEQLETLLEPHLPSRDLFVAVRIDAVFDTVSLRAVPRQEPPYLPLAEVVKNQAQWEREEIAGTLIGIRCPKWVTGISVPGYHWHFLSEDHASGGHVFDVSFQSGKVSFDACRTWVVKLDQGLESQGADLSQDLSADLEKVERQRGKGME
ncbi:acetolactate decarboxylase [Planctomicrobium sp. SH661]|uniref:acetolactate decarboxylase n=1 Tax=Planctomicrobium sp. SH661 TaxID=3448124 RepID=UPI003F5CBBD2